jgi:hypothetical protein
MATEQLAGSAEIRWVEDGTEVETHLLRVPLQQVRAAGRSRHQVSESIDFTVRNTITLAQVYEIIATIRYDDDPIGLVRLLMAGFRGEILTYDNGTDVFDVYMIEPSEEAFEVAMDDNYNIFQEGRMELRLRRTTGEPFTGLFGDELT